MTTTAVLAAIGYAVLVLNAIARLPHAITELARACIPAVTALRELRAAIAGRPPDARAAPSPPDRAARGRTRAVSASRSP
jgi:hypothetical protein